MTGTVTETNREVESIDIQSPRPNSTNFGFTVWYTSGEFRQTWRNAEWANENLRGWAERQGVNWNNLPTINLT